jgi:hypothetical protein
LGDVWGNRHWPLGSDFGERAMASVERTALPALREIDYPRKRAIPGLPRDAKDLPAPRLLSRTRGSAGCSCLPHQIPPRGGNRASGVSPPLRSRQRYRDAIREHLRVKPLGDKARRVAAEAVADAALSMDDPVDLINVAIEELIKERFELPAFSRQPGPSRPLHRQPRPVRPGGRASERCR